MQDGKGGYIITAQDPQLYAEKINALLQNPQACTQMGQFNAEYVAEFSQEKVHQMMDRIYF